MILGQGANNESSIKYDADQPAASQRIGFGRGFEKLEATASAGGTNDQASLYDSTANDIYTVMQNGINEATMLPAVAGAYSRKAAGSTSTTATTSIGTDRARLYDSAGNDILQAGAGTVGGTRTKSPTDVSLSYLAAHRPGCRWGPTS